MDAYQQGLSMEVAEWAVKQQRSHIAAIAQTYQYVAFEIMECFYKYPDIRSKVFRIHIFQNCNIF
jgi:hypothetical protein